jgi:Fe-S oxidoreductase
MRTDWTEELDVNIVSQTSEIDILYWVSCTSALEERNMKVAGAFTKVLKAAGVNFGILGNEEICCGEPARRLGNEYLFQTQVLHTLELLNSYNVDTVVTTCPHCYNTFKNEYPQFGGKFKVFHHSQYIADLVKSGKLKMENGIEKLVTYHDPCYLGRYNDIYKAPRSLLHSIPGIRIMEMDRNHQSSFCCGGGGGHMWMEEHSGRRISDIRIEDAIKTNADILTTACPYCIQLLGDRIRVRDLESIEIMDIAELAELSCRK